MLYGQEAQRVELHYHLVTPCKGCGPKSNLSRTVVYKRLIFTILTLFLLAKLAAHATVLEIRETLYPSTYSEPPYLYSKIQYKFHSPTPSLSD